MSLFFSSFSVSASYPYHSSQFLAMDTSITRFSFDPVCMTSRNDVNSSRHVLVKHLLCAHTVTRAVFTSDLSQTSKIFAKDN